MIAWEQKLFRLGGPLGPPEERNQIGLDMLTSYHTWSEEMFRVSFERAAAGKPVYPSFSRTSDVFQTDATCADSWRRLPSEGPTLLQIIGDLIIPMGNKEGPEVYALVRELTSSKLRQPGVRIDFDRKPDDVVLSYLESGVAPDRLARFFDLERSGTRRAATVIALWWQSRFPGDHRQVRAVIDTLLRQQLDELDQADTRRKIWIAQHSAAGSL